MATSRVSVTISGPLFDGHASMLARQWVEATEEKLALQAAAIIKAKASKMNRSGRGGTGAAAAAVTVGPDGMGWVVRGNSTRGTVWWPWLEGTSKRNRSTAFKGYHPFRLARGVVAKRWRKIAQEELDARIGGMGGA